MLCAGPSSLPDEWLSPATFAVVMNHHLMRDVEALCRLVPSPVPYVGVLGPRRRTERLLARVERELGRALTAEELTRIYSPIGLDIGGESPAAIAVGVVAEILAVRYGRPAPHLRDRRGPLHPDRLEPLTRPGPAEGDPPAPPAAAVCDTA